MIVITFGPGIWYSTVNTVLLVPETVLALAPTANIQKSQCLLFEMDH